MKRLILMLTFSVCAFGKTSKGCGPNIQSAECREKAALLLQDTFNQNPNLPNLNVRTSGDVLVFTDPRNWIRVTQSQGVVEAQPAEGDAVKIASFLELCELGFKKLKIGATDAEGENYELHCSNVEGSPEAKTAVSTQTGSQKEFVIVSASIRVDPTNNNKTCWISASDGNTVYAGYVQKYGFGFVSCPALEMNSRVQGGVSKNQRYLFLLLPHGKKTKQETYTITDMQAAQ